MTCSIHAGQFWNIPVSVQRYHVELSERLREDFDQSNLYLISIAPPSAHGRVFIGELHRRSWDLSLQPCLYVGSSQGGPLSDIPGPRDSVIEGRYTDYKVSGLLTTSFQFSQFDSSFCSS